MTKEAEPCEAGCPPALDQGPDRERRLDIRGQFISRFLWSKDLAELKSWGEKLNTFKDQLSMYDMESLRDYYEATAAEIRLENAMGIKFSEGAQGKESIWLNAKDIPDGKEVEVTIEGVEYSSHFRDEEKEWALTFVGKDKGMILNVRNRRKIEEAYGDDTDKCIGQKVVLYKEPTEYEGKPTMGLRLRIPGQVEDTPF
jgi:hypothetical protein